MNKLIAKRRKMEIRDFYSTLRSTFDEAVIEFRSENYKALPIEAQRMALVQSVAVNTNAWIKFS